MNTRRHPMLYQINTRVLLTDLSRELQRPATLDDIPDSELDRIAEMGFDWVWFLSVWQTSPGGQRVSRTHEEWRREFHETLGDLVEDDIGGSGFSIIAYNVSPHLGGDPALERLRERLRSRGLKLMLDFVPNHVGLDHPWVESHPEYFVQGTERDLEVSPQNFLRVTRQHDELILAHGRDPHFCGWPDTLQLNYANSAVQEVMLLEMLRVASQCDGLRCDMTMLLHPEIFERTWALQSPLFWPTAINSVRKRVPGFVFMAEVYWDLERTMLQQGFDYAYDKKLYDRLREGKSRWVREHFQSELVGQNQLVRFLENHDETRAALVFSREQHQAAAVLAFLSPGLRFFHHGQFEGRQKRISPHLVRAPHEPLDELIHEFYLKLLPLLRNVAVREGEWQLLNCMPAWEGNWTSDNIVVFLWSAPHAAPLVVAVNYSSHQSQCHVSLPLIELAGRKWSLHDELSSATYDWHGDDLCGRGLFLDLRPWQANAFVVSVANENRGEH